MRIDCIIHCWAGQLPQYAYLWMLQLESFARHRPPPGITVGLQFVTADSDTLAAECFTAMRERIAGGYDVERWTVPTREVLRRGHWRNKLALTSKADWIWFGGCDYLVGGSTWPILSGQLQRTNANLAYPSPILVMPEHANGDSAVDRLRRIPLDNRALLRQKVGETANSIMAGELLTGRRWSHQRFSRAIGCLQFLRGDMARQKGYCDQRPETIRPASRWQKTGEDVVFRKTIGEGGGKSIGALELYRLRHTNAGRDDRSVQFLAPTEATDG